MYQTFIQCIYIVLHIDTYIHIGTCTCMYMYILQKCSFAPRLSSTRVCSIVSDNLQTPIKISGEQRNFYRGSKVITRNNCMHVQKRAWGRGYVYSGISLISFKQKKVSLLVKCPNFRYTNRMFRTVSCVLFIKVPYFRVS